VDVVRSNKMSVGELIVPGPLPGEGVVQTRQSVEAIDRSEIGHLLVESEVAPVNIPRLL